MATNYNDERLAQVEAEKQAALNEVEATYGDMINQSDGYYQAQIDASKQWADQQTQLQNEQTDFTIEQIEQQKAQEKKDYTREQSGAYVDWRKQSNEYGANAEEMAAAGLTNTGFSESSQVSMYNTYQNRVATARESYHLAIQNYNNAITEARLQNNSILAEIAYTALQQQLELSLQGFQYKNSLVMAKMDAKNAISGEYWGRYTDVLNQINTESALAEDIRQYNASLAEEQRQYNLSLAEDQRQYDTSLAWDKDYKGQALQIEKDSLAQQKALREAELAENARQFNAEIEEERRQYNETLAMQKAQQAAAAQKAAATKSTKSTSSSSKKKTGSNGTFSTGAKFTGTTYESAVSYMNKKKVAGDVASGVMTKNEWRQRKNAGSTKAYAANYNTYEEYLKDYVAWATSN